MNSVQLKYYLDLTVYFPAIKTCEQTDLICFMIFGQDVSVGLFVV